MISLAGYGLRTAKAGVDGCRITVYKSPDLLARVD
jgi:hypothetical protein